MLNFKGRFAALLIALVLAEPLRSQELIDQYLGIQYSKNTIQNLNALLKALDVGLVKRTLVRWAIPVNVLTKAGDQYTYSSKSWFFNITQVFTPGVPFDYVTADGRNVTSTLTIDGATLHEVEEEDTGRTVTIDRTFSDDELKIVVKVGHVVATGSYRAIAKPKPDDEQPKPDDKKPKPDDEKPKPDDEKPKPDDEKPKLDDEEPKERHDVG